MIDPKVIDTVRQLLAEGKLSYREIALRTGISRSTISSVASGKRVADDTKFLENDAPLQPPGPARRCPNCGGLVYLPCKLCRARAMNLNSRTQAVEDPSSRRPRWADDGRRRA